MNKTEAIILMLMSLGAFFMPFLSRKMRIPSAVGEILYGMIIGAVFNLNEQPMKVVEYFSSFGFLILMYLAGLELNFDRFRLMPKKDIWLYVVMFTIIGGCSFLSTSLLNLHWTFTLIFFTTGIGLLFPVLKDADIIGTDFGQNLLIIAMIGEILTLIGITGVTMTYKYGLTFQSMLHTAYIVIFFIVIYIILRVLKMALWWNPKLQSLFLSVDNPTETGMRANFVILFFFVALAHIVQIEAVVGAFVGGMLFAIVFAGREAVLAKLGGVGYGFFVPVFFTSVGMKFSFSDIVKPSVLIFAAIIIGIMFLTRIIGGAALFFSSLGRQNILNVALGLSFPLTMLVAVSSICSEAGIITHDESSSILLSAMIGAILYPWLFKMSMTAMLQEEAMSAKKFK